MVCSFRRGMYSFACTALTVIAGFTVASSALAQSAALSRKAVGRVSAPELLSTAQNTGHVRVIVLFNSPVPVEAVRPDAASVAAVRSQVASVRNAILATHFGGAEPASIGFPRALTSFPITPGFALNVTAQELESLATDSRVLSIQIDGLDKPTLNDSVPLIGMPGAYASGALGNGQAVAILDTGVKANHELLSGKVIGEACFSNGSGGAVSLCPNGNTTQTGSGAADPNSTNCNTTGGATAFNLCYHGTHVAGIAAGLNTNTNYASGEPLSGVGKFSNILAIQVFTRFNDTTNCGGTAPCALSYTSDQISALNYVYSNLSVSGIPIASINMSLGGGSYSSTCDSDSRKSIIDSLRNAGVLTAIASGNDGSTSTISAPGCISSAITVGSTSKTDIISSFSNMSNVVDVLAPGGESGGACSFTGSPAIVSSVVVNNGSTTSYGCLVGTSMATPHVAGAIAALKSRYPGATASFIETALKNTGLTIADTRSGGTISKPRIRVNRAVDQAWWTWSIAGVGNFNPDTKNDILWRNTNGDVYLWLMNGASIGSAISLGNVDKSWSIVAVADFNGDGTSDILWRNDNGTMAVWLMSSTSPGTIQSTNFIGSASNVWSVAGVGNFTASGRQPQILFRKTDGTLFLWYTNGVTVSATQSVGQVSIDWSVAGVGDFNADGLTDIGWRNRNGSALLWLMQNGVPSTSAMIGSPPLTWSIAGVSDLVRDGKADLLWHNSDGTTVIWKVNGLAAPSTVNLGTVPTSWHIFKTGSFDGTSNNILWRNSDGTVALWYLDANGAFVSFASLGVVQ